MKTEEHYLDRIRNLLKIRQKSWKLMNEEGHRLWWKMVGVTLANCLEANCGMKAMALMTDAFLKSRKVVKGNEQ